MLLLRSLRLAAAGAASLALAGCFLVYDFEDKAAGGGGAQPTGGGGAGATGGGGAGAGGTGGTGGGGPAGGGGAGGGVVCGDVGVFSGGDVEIRSMAVDAASSRAWVALLYDADSAVTYSHGPVAECAELEIPGSPGVGLTTAVAELDLSTLQITWWARVATSAGPSRDQADVDLAVFSTGNPGESRLLVAGTFAGGALFNYTDPGNGGFGWSTINWLSNDDLPAGLGLEKTLDRDQSCQSVLAGQVQRLASSAHPSGFHLVASTNGTLSCTATCSPSLGTVSATTLALWRVDDAPEGACESTNGAFELDSTFLEARVEPSVGSATPANVGVAFLTTGLNAEAQAFGVANLGSTPTYLPQVLGEVRSSGALRGRSLIGGLAGQQAMSAVASVGTATTARTLVLRQLAGGTWRSPHPTDADVELVAHGVTIDDGARTLVTGTIAEPGLLVQAFQTPAFSNAATIVDNGATPGCMADLAEDCGDAFWVLVSELQNNVAVVQGGERWKSAGHQAIHHAGFVSDAEAVLAGSFVEELAVPGQPALTMPSGWFVVRRPLPMR